MCDDLIEGVLAACFVTNVKGKNYLRNRVSSWTARKLYEYLEKAKLISL